MEILIPFLNDSNRHIKNEQIFFNGINRNELTNDNEWIDVQNVDTVDMPAISPRKSMKQVHFFDNEVIGYLGYENVEFIIVKGDTANELYMSEVNKAPVLIQKLAVKPINDYEMIIFNRHLLIFPSCEAFKLNYKDDRIHNIVTNLSEYEDFSKAGGNKNGLDNISHAIEYKNRIFIVDDEDNVKCSAIGNYKIWDKYAGVLSDSWATDVASAGKFKALKSYRDHLMLFKNSITYELYGDTPAQFLLKEAFTMGAVSSNAVCEVQGQLFFVDSSGVQVYGGGIPKSVTYKLRESYEDANCWTDNRRFFMSLKGNIPRTYVYDTEMNQWTGYCNKFFKYFTTVEVDGIRKIRGVTEDNKILEFESGNEKVDWVAISKIYDDKTFQKKSIRRLKFKCHMNIGSEIEFFISHNQEPPRSYSVIKHTTDYSNMREVVQYIPLQRNSTIQIIIKGKGHSVVYGEREVVYRSDKK